jgi:DNA polymerase elongation subunit (family B)
LFGTEAEMLAMFLDLIDDADVLSGWNSEGFDIPYTIMRINRVLSRDDTRRMCLWGQFPKQRTFERFGAENLTFDLIGRVHMDYMQLYRKYTYEERHSYSLDSILEYEELEGKTKYEGTLDQLYNQDFRKFIEYNRQDVNGLASLDKKLKFLDLANTLAHENTVLLPTTMGAGETQ